MSEAELCDRWERRVGAAQEAFDSVPQPSRPNFATADAYNEAVLLWWRSYAALHAAQESAAVGLSERLESSGGEA